MENVFIIAMDKTAEGKRCISKETLCDLETLLSLTTHGQLREDLKRLYPDGTCYVLGVQEGTGDNLATWAGMVAGDLILGYWNYSIVSASYLLAKTNDSTLAMKLWHGDAKGPFGLICFTDKPLVGEVPISPQMYRYFNREYGHFTKLTDEKVRNILTDYGSLETFVHLCLNYDFPFSFRHS